ncbi:MAG: glutamate-5-semialdehyde dehydrogenase [Acutalibacteraceae bacterium]|nr:glutamate-5-semialdehyde dehydrogenase [Acutalibacteraceae bacterium]
MRNTNDIIESAQRAKKQLYKLNTQKKNDALKAMADYLLKAEKEILEANKKDVELAADKLSNVMIDRLTLNSQRIEGMAKGICDLIALRDPVGNILSTVELPNGLKVEKTCVPFGVVAIIYESRPNVTSDAAALALKSGNVCILRGGKEAFNTSYEIVKALKRGLKSVGLDENLIQFVEETTHASADCLLKAQGKVDLLIPRGGKGLILHCVQNAVVPVIQTGTGICHIYVDRFADFDKALDILENAKCSRPSVCNAAEVLVVDSAIADKFLPLADKRLYDDRKAKGLEPVEFKCCENSLKYMKNGHKAEENDFDTEFSNYILAVKTVDDVSAACEHIEQHSTHHSDAIITENEQNALLFTSAIDSAAVYVNASTRFTDGGEFGLGCEMGISTQKLHARGPMGLNELTSYKYIVKGNGQVR